MNFYNNEKEIMVKLIEEKQKRLFNKHFKNSQDYEEFKTLESLKSKIKNSTEILDSKNENFHSFHIGEGRICTYG